jgi:nitrate reductase gamma subunit
MATQLKSSTKPGVPNRRGQSEQIKQYVNHQLEKTRRQVKTTDLIGGILTILAFAILFLMAVAIWDAWIMPLSTLGRWICLSVLLGGSMLYAGLAIVPLFVRRINTEYAAKMIEDAKPTFKNSLLNYVSLRKKKSNGPTCGL